MSDSSDGPRTIASSKIGVCVSGSRITAGGDGKLANSEKIAYALA